MSDLGRKYQEIVNDIDKNVKDAKEREYVKAKVGELAVYFANAVMNILDANDKIGRIDENVKKIHRRLDDIEDEVYMGDDEDDFYDYDENDEEEFSDQMHDNDYDFEITCPYCDFDFLTDSSYKNTRQIRCPKCHRIIELDWSNKDFCDGECNTCNDHCYYDYNEVEKHFTPKKNGKSGKIAKNEAQKSQKKGNERQKNGQLNVAEGKDDIYKLDNKANGKKKAPNSKNESQLPKEQSKSEAQDLKDMKNEQEKKPDDNEDDM